ncbi:MAG: hypothetical protein B9S34_08475 [Opitutia bacterium Tous-C1TDCM]|nr:MAG: hypothetical protein B9S34_08475 [Opitutae bacterium Tous-C1TDCM]
MPCFPRLGLVAALAACWSTVIAADVRVETDVAFLEAGRTEKLDLYLPAAAPAGGKPAPALVWIHGGGWTGGTKNENRAKEIGTTLAAAGYVVASIDYRLGAGAWPQNLRDCKNAVRFLRAHAAKYGIDPQRIAVGGGSAGGHLALMVAYTAGQPDLEPAAPYPGVGSEVDCVLNFYGITNILTRRATDPKGVPLGTSKLGGAASVFGASDAADPVLKLGSPVTHVRPGVPPTLILHGRADATVDHLQAEELAAVLARHGVPHELHLIDNVGHTFALRNWGKKKMSRDLTPVVLAFLARHVR